MKRVLDEIMNTIVFCGIALTVGMAWFVILSLAVNGHVKW